MAHGGAKVWYFPDGYLPEKVAGSALEAHEALMVLNVHDQPARLTLDVYFDTQEPVKDILLTVEAERCVCFRMDMPEHLRGARIPPMTQYGLRLRSDVPVVAMFGRLDTTQPNLAYYINTPYCEED
jgi:hypothetical protein